MRKAAVIALLVPVAVIGAWKAVPYLNGPAPAIEATPVPPPTYAVGKIRLPPGGRLCTDAVTFSADSRFVQVASARRPARGTKLTLTARAPGYRSASRFPPAGGKGTLVAGIDPPGQERTGTVCVANVGTRPVTLAALPPLVSNRDRNVYPTRSRSTLVGGGIEESLSETLSVTLLRSTGQSRLSNLPDAVSHAATLRPLVPAIVWLVAILLLVGVPLALAAATGLAAGRRDEEAPLSALGRATDRGPSNPEAR